ncbi:polymorphic toxin-type HINT domain-containing protein [Streptomyces sp. NPDC004008]
MTYTPARVLTRRRLRWHALAAATVAGALLVTAAPTFAATPKETGGADTDTYAYPGRLKDTAAPIRTDVCRLGVILHAGGPALKAVAKSGLTSTDPAELHRLANPEYWNTTPLSTAYDKDQASYEKTWNTLGDRHLTWDKSIPGNFDLPGMTNTAFHWSPDYYGTLGVTKFYVNQYFKGEDSLYGDLAPIAQPASMTAATALAKNLHLYSGKDETSDNLAEAQAWQALGSYEPFDDGKVVTGNKHADDVRIFLQDGGFPRTAPDAGSVEYRMEVEALKLRFASCDSDNPLDPNHVLGSVVKTAGAEWQSELDAQAAQRADIVAAEIQANSDLQTASQAMVESVGQSWIAGQLAKWQSYWTKHPKDSSNELSYPKPADFTYATKEIGNARTRAAAQLTIANKAAADAKAQADKVTAAETAAGKIAAANNTPYGRGLAYAQQSAQVTKASSAAAAAAAKATQTAVNAAKASVDDSAALMSLAKTQAEALKAEFRKAAAQEAAAQAHAAAVAAAAQATTAANAAATAKADRATAEKAQATAASAAADAAAQRGIAQQQAANAAADRALAENKRQIAAADEADARSQQATAESKQAEAEQAEATAAQKKTDAQTAESQAADARGRASDAADRRDALNSRAAAAEAAAAAADGTSAADGAKAAATKAQHAADDASTAADKAEADADDASNAAIAARAAATNADAAAKKARAAANRAQSDADTTRAAAATAHSAAADAISAARQSAGAADAATALAASAQADARKAADDAVAARAAADQARKDSATTAGQAYAAALSAAAARDSAAAVTAPANDAIALGTPFRANDSSAALAVLVGQGAKTVAQQQQAAAEARAKDAADAAKLAQAAAAKAGADAKAAAQAAADAATDAAAAAKSAAAARTSAAAAAEDAAAAATADAATARLNAQAQADAAAANNSANSAESDAAAADSAATEAERDAAAARSAAAQARDAATAAQKAADQAAKDAADAQEAAKNAQADSEAAEKSAKTAEAQAQTAARQSRVIDKWDGGYAILETADDLTITTDPGGCTTGSDGTCDIDVPMHISGTVYSDVLICYVTSPTSVDCLRQSLATRPVSFSEHRTLHIVAKDMIQASLKNLVHIVAGDFIDCANGKASGCAWAAANFIPYGKISEMIKSVVGLRRAMEAGKGIEEAWVGVKAAGLDADALAGLEEEVQVAEDAFANCALNSFPADTRVLLADGSHKAIGDIRVGDRLLATDPDTRTSRVEPVTASFAHSTGHLVDITLSGAGRLTTTAGHRVYVVNAGWTFASDLRVGDLLRAADGSTRAVTGLRDRQGIAPQSVYDLTVDGLHTFYVRTAGTRAQDVLVHNCNDLVKDAAEYPDQAHVLDEHVNPTPQRLDELVAEKGVNSVFIDEQTAQQVVDYAIADDVAKKAKNPKSLTIAKWLASDSTEPYTIKGTFGAKNSLGKVYRANGAVTDAGNGYVVLLKKAPRTASGKHPLGYYVFTAYPV